MPPPSPLYAPWLLSPQALQAVRCPPQRPANRQVHAQSHQNYQQQQPQEEAPWYHPERQGRLDRYVAMAVVIHSEQLGRVFSEPQFTEGVIATCIPTHRLHLVAVVID